MGQFNGLLCPLSSQKHAVMLLCLLPNCPAPVIDQVTMPHTPDPRMHVVMPKPHKMIDHYDDLSHPRRAMPTIINDNLRHSCEHLDYPSPEEQEQQCPHFLEP